MLQIIGLLLGGFVLLVAGSDTLIKGSVMVARRLKLSDMLIGIVLVGFGTSMPELLTSIIALRENQPGLSIGNIIGSNIADILLIMGLCALINALVITDKKAFKLNIIFLFISCFLLTAASIIGNISMLTGAVFLLFITTYVIWYYRMENKSQEKYKLDIEAKNAPLPIGLLLSAAGFAGLLFGANLFIKGAVDLARAFNVSETFIGLTIVAVGTSLPELAASVTATLRKKNDIALGNILGSCIFNILFIAGVGSFVKVIPVSQWLASVDLWVMNAAIVWLAAMLAINRKISFWWGTISIAAYLAYILYLVSEQLGYNI